MKDDPQSPPSQGQESPDVIAAPMPTEADLREVWGRRYRARIVARCMEPLTEEAIANAKERYGDDFEPWTQETAQAAADAEFEAVEFHEIYDGYENDPEGSADESISAWSD